jgi:hypothetical protein
LQNKQLRFCRSCRKLPLADLPVFIKVPAPEFRHGMSGLG